MLLETSVHGWCQSCYNVLIQRKLHSLGLESENQSPEKMVPKLLCIRWLYVASQRKRRRVVTQIGKKKKRRGEIVELMKLVSTAFEGRDVWSPAPRPQMGGLAPRPQRWSPEPRSPLQLMEPLCNHCQKPPDHYQQASWPQIRHKHPSQ